MAVKVAKAKSMHLRNIYLSEKLELLSPTLIQTQKIAE